MDRLIPDPETVQCPACGHENPASHKFCGSCGATLLARTRTAAAPPERVDRHENLPAEEKEYADEQPQQEPRHDPQPFESSITNPHELSLFRSFRPSDGSEEDWYEEQRSPYRIYIALVLAILIGGLAYMAWRTSKSGTQNAHEAPPPPAANENNPAPSASAPAKQADTSASKSAPAATPPAATSEQPVEPAKASPPASTKAAARPPAEEARPQPAIDNGSAELAEAQRYLGAHDDADAAKWLWKSIAKHNGQATVLLADLYLKGEGVSKNCDQARVLLDSAARKGVSGAGERLRNLQAFGCQ